MVVAEINPQTGAAIASELAAGGAQALFHQTDVADPASVAAMSEAVRAAFGPPDILVNNAGVNVFRDPRKWATKIGADAWRSIWKAPGTARALFCPDD